MINQFLFLRYSALSDTDDKYTALLQCAGTMQYVILHSQFMNKKMGFECMVWAIDTWYSAWYGVQRGKAWQGTLYGMARHGTVYSVVLTEAINTSDEEEGTRLDPRG